jgi:hypothetical protein
MKMPGALSRTFARQALVTQKNAPTILFGTGVIGMVGSTVLACRATLKLSDVLVDAKNDLKLANDIPQADYDEANQKRGKDVAIIYGRNVGKVAKLYGPSILLGAASIGCLTKSHNLLNERNVALTAAYGIVDGAFKQYRARVVEEYGEEADKRLRYNLEEVDVVGENGKKQKQLALVEGDPDGHSQYARFFDSHNANWNPEPEYNWVFLRCQQNWANDMLKARGHLFLNEVYDALGMEHTTAGSVVGWYYSATDGGDNYVDFGLYNADDVLHDYVTGREGAVLLDFNVDGVIYDKIGG